MTGVVVVAPKAAGGSRRGAQFAASDPSLPMTTVAFTADIATAGARWSNRSHVAEGPIAPEVRCARAP